MTRIYNNKPPSDNSRGKPDWTQGNKDGMGTAHGRSTRLWFSLSEGVITEVYYPTIYATQIREVQYVIGDGKNFILQEKDHLHPKIEPIASHVLGYRMINADPEGHYQIYKEIITDPLYPCLLQYTKITGEPDAIAQLKLYVFCSPHQGVSSWEDNAAVVEVAGRKILTAEQDGIWVAMAATVPFTHLCCGYTEENEGWTNFANNPSLRDGKSNFAQGGNVSLMGELDLQKVQEFTLGVGFGDRCQDAIATLFLSLDIPFEEHREKYIQQWSQISKIALPLGNVAGDGGNLYDSSFSLLRAHEDKTYPSATIESGLIPGDSSKRYLKQGAYHFVWPQALVNTVTGLLAAGHSNPALQALIYLAVSQCKDGGFSQNFWMHGQSYSMRNQLDQVSFPICLAWRMYREKALRNFDPYPIILKAARYLVDRGPATYVERWEENSGYSPSTLATNIAALICAGSLARVYGDPDTALFLEEYADFLEEHLEEWTVTNEGTLVQDIPRHYIRINPLELDNPCADEALSGKVLTIANRSPDQQSDFLASEIVDAGFLELVRYGIRRPDDPLILDSLKVVDAVLKVETPHGPCWHRYNQDGYGQREDGGPFQGAGKGRAWPLLTGERGHYELAAGRDVMPYIQAMEGFATSSGLLPEQIWDEEDRPDLGLYLGRATGAQLPLAWVHSEYLKLLRSRRDGEVFDLIPEVADRYWRLDKPSHPTLEIWKFNRQVTTVKAGSTLRILAIESFRLSGSNDGWKTSTELNSQSSGIDIEFVDWAIGPEQEPLLDFTFFWKARDRWEGKNYQVQVVKG